MVADQAGSTGLADCEGAVGPQRDRQVHPKQARSEGSRPVARSRPAHLDPARQLRSDRTAAFGGEVDAFARDTAPDAYEKLIDRLLASPRYGERWGRHWLDVARYADSVNDSVNAGQRYPWSYTYRDWVIRSFNDDLPYDQFVLYQIAADRVGRRRTATSGRARLPEPGRRIPEELSGDSGRPHRRGFARILGLTVACARCHDHKYDPIPTRGLLFALFHPLEHPRARRTSVCSASRPLSPKQELYRSGSTRSRKTIRNTACAGMREMVAFFKTQTADYLVAARDAEG